MRRYSILESDGKLLESLRSSRSVFIVGCTHCANISIGYDRNLPIFYITHDNRTGIKSAKPIAVVREAERLKRLFKNRGLKADVEVFPPICSAIESDDAEIHVPMGFDRSIRFSVP